MKSTFPYYQQLDSVDCGPTSLRMIARYYGRNFSLETLRSHSYISNQGVSLLGISNAAESIGFRTRGIRIDMQQLVSIPLPCILYWNQNHFVVCYKIRRKRWSFIYSIADPAKGKYTVDETELRRNWINPDGEGQGIALTLTPTPEFYNHEDEVAAKSKDLSYFLQYLFPYKSQIFQLLVGMVLGGVFSMIFPFLTQAVVDQGIGNNNL